ncbi:unnamed protein product [Diabrotica balteata]|uniref:BPTI/Kunitz inhibitor domain-containing protein n=1 Tax=Diabrotica balteata TaxID=107213 RepID=A0A9N9XE09_DIABA|nr:unnamed protein product [Diabrotica balteata]
MKIIFFLFSLAVLSAQPETTQGHWHTGNFIEHDCFFIPYIPPCSGTAVDGFIWKWEIQSKKCVRVHSKLGCPPTNNNFNSSKDCDSIARKVCKKVIFMDAPILMKA